MRPDSQSECRRSWVRKIKRLPGIAHLSRQADQHHEPDRRNGAYLRNGLSRGKTDRAWELLDRRAYARCHDSVRQPARAEEEDNTDARLWHPWLRINRVLRAMLQTRWSAEAWSVVRVEFTKALALRSLRSHARTGSTRLVPRPPRAARCWCASWRSARLPPAIPTEVPCG
jgi:hypothetical protein